MIIRFIIWILCRTSVVYCMFYVHDILGVNSPISTRTFFHCHQYSKQKFLVTVSDITQLKPLSQIYMLQLSISGVVRFWVFAVVYEVFILLECDAVLLDVWFLTFQITNFFNPLRQDHYIFSKCSEPSPPPRESLLRKEMNIVS